MKKFLLTVLLFSSLLSYGQSNTRLWEEGRLTWSDFKGKPFATSPNASEINSHLSYETIKKRFGDTVLFTFVTRNYINPNASWVKEFSMSNQLLKYNQVIFDIQELYRRELQVQLHRIDGLYLAEEKFRTVRQDCYYEIKRFQNDTQMGFDKDALDYWHERVAQLLEVHPLEVIPGTSDKNFGYGLHFGFGTGLFTGTISEYFTPTFNFIFGFDFAYKNTLLFLNATLAGNRTKKDYVEEELLWPKDLRSNVAIIDLSIGQTVVENAKHKITPFVGLGILEFSVAEKEGEAYEDHRIVNYGLIYGLNYDFKFQKRIRLTPSYGAPFRERVDQKIRVKVYATSANYESMKGTSINFTLGYAIFGRFIRINDYYK